MDGAPVLGYVFPTTLEPEDVGFGDVEGIVALAATSHPDFDDTPLWDENGNRVYGDDGVRFHSHWVLLVEDRACHRWSGGQGVPLRRRNRRASTHPSRHAHVPRLARFLRILARKHDQGPRAGMARP